MRVLVFEPKFVGHFLGFAAFTAKAFAQLGCEVTLVFPVDAEGSEQAKIKLADLPENVHVRYTIDVPKLYKRWINADFETEALSLVLDDVPTDHLVIPSGDFVLSGLLKRGGLRKRLKALGGVDLVLHHCHQVYPDMGIRQRCKCFLDRMAVSLAGRIRLLTVDPYAISSESVSHMALWGNPVQPLPHFRETTFDPLQQDEARVSLDLPATGKLLGSIGDLGRRKGTELLIRSFADSEPGENDYLVLFGILSGTAKQALEQQRQLVAAGRILSRDRFVSNDEFHQFFYAMDAIWTGFPHQIGIASTQLYAAEAGRPVISSDYGAVGWLTNEYGLGRTFPGNISSMTEAIRWFHRQEDWQPDPSGLEHLLKYHTTANFNDHMTRAVRQRMKTSATDSRVGAIEEGAL
jgi:glycosyltransferase involved in cell wall biosynthesis